MKQQLIKIDIQVSSVINLLIVLSPLFILSSVVFNFVSACCALVNVLFSSTDFSESEMVLKFASVGCSLSSVRFRLTATDFIL
jgi:hypothetical protein